MPIILRGTVGFDVLNGEFFLKEHDGQDGVSRILEKYHGKNIDLVISVREHSSVSDAPDGCRREASRF